MKLRTRYRLCWVVGGAVLLAEMVYKQVIYGNFMHSWDGIAPALFYLAFAGLVFYGLYGEWIKRPPREEIEAGL